MLLFHFDEQPIQNGTALLIGRPFNFRVFELWIDCASCSDCFRPNFIRVAFDEDLECHPGVVALQAFTPSTKHRIYGTVYNLICQGEWKEMYSSSTVSFNDELEEVHRV